MDKAGLFTLTSGLHSEVIPDVSEEVELVEVVPEGPPVSRSYRQKA